MRTSKLCALVLLLAAIAAQDAFATGALFVKRLGSNTQYETMSIDTYDATVRIQDQIAVTHVDQRFFNHSNFQVESTFIFPLPEGAVITEMAYWFNGKRYSGSIREKKAAQQAYNDKIRRLLDPALLQYIGQNVFKLNIAPINANSEVRFEITYTELLTYDAGTVDYRFLLNTTGLSPTPLERISVSLTAETSGRFKTFASASHAELDISMNKESDSKYTLTYGDEHFMPDRDLLVQFETERDGVDMNVITYTPVAADSIGTGSFYALWITPPDDIDPNDIIPRDIVFTADVSSSMDNERLTQLKIGMNTFLDGLSARDRFNIVVFSTDTRAFREDLVEATPQAISAARDFIHSLGAVGLTNIDAALRASLNMGFGATSSNMLMFFTDGLPTWGELDETTIIENAVAVNSAGVRIFTIGLGEDVSQSLLRGISNENGGFATFIDQSQDIAAVVARHFERVSRPVLANLGLNMGGLAFYDVYPTELPDLFWGRQVLQFGRYTGGGTHTVSLSGMVGPEPFNLQRDVNFGAAPGGNKACARLWAGTKINFLLEEIDRVGEQKELVDAIIDLSIRFQILTPYTALYADPDDPDNPVSGIEDEADGVITGLGGWKLHRNYPNPFGLSTHIGFTVPEEAAYSRVSIRIYDALGRLVAVLFDAAAAAGKHTVEWNGRGQGGEALPNGTYHCRLEAGQITLTTTIILAR